MFPLDLTQDYLKNKYISVDTSTFKSKMIEQKERARKNWRGTGDVADNKIWFLSTENLDCNSENKSFLDLRLLCNLQH